MAHLPPEPMVIEAERLCQFFFRERELLDVGHHFIRGLIPLRQLRKNLGANGYVCFQPGLGKGCDLPFHQHIAGKSPQLHIHSRGRENVKIQAVQKRVEEASAKGSGRSCIDRKNGFRGIQSDAVRPKGNFFGWLIRQPCKGQVQPGVQLAELCTAYGQQVMNQCLLIHIIRKNPCPGIRNVFPLIAAATRWPPVHLRKWPFPGSCLSALR